MMAKTELQMLRDLTFRDTLHFWPYRSLRRPADEQAALEYCHKVRLTFPGLTLDERNESLRILQAKGYYPWVKPFGEEKLKETATLPSPKRKKGKRK